MLRVMFVCSAKVGLLFQLCKPRGLIFAVQPCLPPRCGLAMGRSAPGEAAAGVMIFRHAALAAQQSVPQGVARRAVLRCEMACSTMQNGPFRSAERPVLQAKPLALALRQALLSVFFLSLRRAITVRSPVVACPIFTHTSVPMGRNTSTLDPSFMKPRCSSM